MSDNRVELRRLLNETEFQLRILAAPLPARTFHDGLLDWHGRLNSSGLGWSGREIDYLERLLGAPAERILTADEDSITLSSGVVTREQIRTAARPPWQPEDEWRETAEFNALRRAHEGAIARSRARKAEQAVKVSAEPAASTTCEDRGHEGEP